MKTKFFLSTFTFTLILLSRSLSGAQQFFTLGLKAAISYGVIHNQVTARISPHYFTEGFHRKMAQENPLLSTFPSLLKSDTSPSIIGTLWGLASMWHMGPIMATPVAIAARAGSWAPKLEADQFIKPLTRGLTYTGVAAAIAATAGYYFSKDSFLQKISQKDVDFYKERNPIKAAFLKKAVEAAQKEGRAFYEPNEWAFNTSRSSWQSGNTPIEALPRFISASCAHKVSYLGGALTSIALTTYALQQRYKLSRVY